MLSALVLAVVSTGFLFVMDRWGINMLNNFFINKNEDLKKLYKHSAQEHPENHYGTFEQFIEVLYSFRGKAGFDIKFEDTVGIGKVKFPKFVVKSDEGTEIDFNNVRMKITIDRKREDPLDLGEPIWWENADGTKKMIGAKKRNTRVYEYFVFSSLREFDKFIRWSNTVEINKSKFFKKNEMLLKSKDSQKVKLDVENNYWGLDKEAKKIYNMKEKELDKLIQLDSRENEFKTLERAERLQITGR
jgi:hypothetical protein